MWSGGGSASWWWQCFVIVTHVTCSRSSTGSTAFQTVSLTIVMPIKTCNSKPTGDACLFPIRYDRAAVTVVVLVFAWLQLINNFAVQRRCHPRRPTQCHRGFVGIAYKTYFAPSIVQPRCQLQAAVVRHGGGRPQHGCRRAMYPEGFATVAPASAHRYPSPDILPRRHCLKIHSASARTSMCRRVDGCPTAARASAVAAVLSQ